MNSKASHTIFSFLLIGILALTGQDLTINQAEQSIIPSPVVQKLRLGNRAGAARQMALYIDSLEQNGRHSDAGLHLKSGILWYIADSVTKGEDAYNIYIRRFQSDTKPGRYNPEVSLIMALRLGAENQNKPAVDTLMRVISVTRANNLLDSLILAETYRFLARFNKRNGDNHEALRFYDRSLDLNKRMERTYGIADNLADMGSVRATINPSDPQADSLLLEALELFTQIGDKPSLSIVYNELAALEVLRKNNKEALKYLHNSLDIKKSIPGYRNADLITVLNNLGSVNFYEGNREVSNSYYRLAIKYSKESGRNPATFYANMGVNYAIDKEYDIAISLMQNALGNLDPECDPNDPDSNPHVQYASPNLAEFTAFKAHALNYRFKRSGDKEDLRKGLETYMLSLEMMDTLRYLYSFESKPLLGKEFKIHYFHALEMALDLYKLTNDIRYLDQAIQFSGRSKSATLNEFIRVNSARKYLQEGSAYLVQEDSIKRLIAALDSKLIEINESGFSQDTLTTSLLAQKERLTDELRNFQTQIRKENPEFFKKVYSNRGYPLATLQNLLEPGEAMLDYTIIDKNNLILLTLTRDSAYYYRKKMNSDLVEHIDRFKLSLSQFPTKSLYDQFIESSHFLYTTLVQPAAIPLGINKLLVLPDEEIGFLPFEAFLVDTVKPRSTDFSKLNYLNRKFSIAYVSSHEHLASFRSGMHQERVERIEAFAPFVKEGSDQVPEGLPALSESGKELKSISKGFRTRLHLNRSATEEKIVQSLNSPVMVHISTHGVLNLDKPMETRLLFQPAKEDGSLYLFEMLSLKTNSPLVFLNACNSGTGTLQAGEGILSMARGFQFAGVPSLITTLWTVDDKAAAKISALFFENLRDSMPRREALQQARITYLDNCTRDVSSPYFWAAQILIGDTDPVILVKPHSRLLIPALITGGLLLLVLLVWLLLKKRH